MSTVLGVLAVAVLFIVFGAGQSSAGERSCDGSCDGAGEGCGACKAPPRR